MGSKKCVETEMVLNGLRKQTATATVQQPTATASSNNNNWELPVTEDKSECKYETKLDPGINDRRPLSG
ncbi:GL18113 [Drosophila persimilis]|uniref:GL18113 n=1 Tax=Drosophila persimilis TaxID=7234 RepID=B4HC11_DROPE|nr:GL18113 [Drosophila persimilis]